jgi:STE24 endopeptidase
MALPVLDTTPALDVERATREYLARVSGQQREQSDAYAQGGYWLLLLNLAWTLAIAGLLMGFGLSARLRDWAEEKTHSRTYQVMIYAAVCITAVMLLSLPLALYEGHFREHAYGLSNQSLLGWLGDFGIAYLLTLVVGIFCLPILYAVIRAARETWWLWGGALAILFLVVKLTVWPIFIAPLFSDNAPLADGPLKARIESLATANQVPVGDIYVTDASRRTSRIAADVSGFLGTTRITLNDNLLARSSEDEVLAVLGHEIGHYVIGHTTRAVLLQGLLILLGFGFTAWGFTIGADLFGGMWQVRRVDDVAGLPALVALLSLFAVLALPLSNAISRSAEAQADLYGLNAVRKPDALATLILKQAPTRKLEPGSIEETIFNSYPSGSVRIATAMRWKSQHMAAADIRDMAGPGVIAP